MGLRHRVFFCDVLIFLLFSASANASPGRPSALKEEPQKASLLKSGKSFLKEGEYQEAVECFENYLGSSSTRDQNALECYMNLETLHWNLDQLKEAAEDLERASELARSLNLSKDIERCAAVREIHRLFSQAVDRHDRGDLAQSNMLFEKAEREARIIHSPAHELKILKQWSLNFIGDSSSKRFFDLNKQALGLALDLKHKAFIMNIANNLGSYCAQKNDYSHSLSYYTKALECAQALKNRKIQATCLSNMAYVYVSLGDYQKAYDYVSEALRFPSTGESSSFLATLLNNLGQTFRTRSHVGQTDEYYSRALECFKSGFDLAQKAGSQDVAQAAMINMGEIYVDLDEFDLARALLSSALEKANRSKDFTLSGNAFLNLATIALKQKDAAKAEAEFQKSLAEAKKSRDLLLTTRALFGLGRCQELSEDYGKALSFYDEAIRTIDAVGLAIVSDIDRSEFIYSERQIYQRLVDLRYRLFRKGGSKIFENGVYSSVERMKARSFVEYLERQSQLKSPAEPEEESRSQVERWKRERLDHLRMLSQEDLSSARKQELESRIKRLEDMLHTAFLDRYLQSGTEKVFTEPVALDVLRQDILGRNAGFVEYFLGDDRSFLILVTADLYKVIELPPAKSIADSLRAYLRFLNDPDIPASKGVAASERLYRELFSPAENLLSPLVTRIIIVPDGILFDLPFETLISSSSGRRVPQYLIDRFSISYAPSASALFALKKRPKSRSYPKEILAFGDPAYPGTSPSKRIDTSSASHILAEFYRRNGYVLSPIPHSRTEVRDISKGVRPDKKDIFLGRDASEKALKAANLSDYRIIHFACHAFSDEGDPLRSAIVLSLNEDGEEDGFFEVAEMYKMRMEADLVVLSSCQTGTGKNLTNEGILGLPRVFFYMGSRSVISTLWPIDDRASALFMKYFYELMAQGFDKARALGLAKKKMMASKYAHPYYWGAFILTGES
jgi:CHAT domain-containing protein/Tfp pilus assembly protein PilF